MNEKNVNIPNIGIAKIADYTPSKDEENLILQFEADAEKDIEEKKQSANVNFRWSEFEIIRAKKIAKQLGLPYQTYLKSLLKQGMDNDEKRLSM